MQVIRPVLMPNLPAKAEFPITFDTLSAYFNDILLSSRLSISFGFFENTSDVLLTRADWDSHIDSFSLMVVAVNQENVNVISGQVLEIALPKVKEWLVSTSEDLHAHPDDWSYPGLTVSHENGTLAFESRTGIREGKRPAPRWYENP